MFEGPEYASYIALMRGLWLSRQFEQGDWFLPGASDDPTLWTNSASHAATATNYWLPRLDQWLAMLEEAGMAYVDFSSVQKMDGGPAGVILTHGVQVHSDASTTRIEVQAPTREEAVARLWMAVTRQAGPTAPASTASSPPARG